MIPIKLKYLFTDNGFRKIPVVFTGVEDKNGEEIYQDDIVLYMDRYYRVCWRQDECRWEVQNKHKFLDSDATDIVPLGYGFHKKMEVVGNYNEKDKDLLKKIWEK